MKNSSDSWDESSEESDVSSASSGDDAESDISSEQSDLSSDESELSELSSELSELSSEASDLSDISSELSESSQSSDSSSSSEAAIEIQVNESDEANDDLVRLKSLIPPKRFKTPCLIRLTERRPHTSITVDLTNPDGRLRFYKKENDPPGPGISLPLPANGDPVRFWISGEVKSLKLNDAVIKVFRGEQLLGKAFVTVFYFEPSDITVGRGHPYPVLKDTPGEYRPITGNVVNYSASAVIKPTGVNCKAEQIKKLRIGIVQNVSGVRYVARYKDPEIVDWDPLLPSGTPVNVPLEVDVVTAFTGPYLDASENYHPQYQLAIGDDPVQKPVGCDGKRATSWDNPKSELFEVYPLLGAPANELVPVERNGVRVAGARYKTPHGWPVKWLVYLS